MRAIALLDAQHKGGPYSRRLEYYDCRGFGRSDEGGWVELDGYTKSTVEGMKAADMPDGRCLGCYFNPSGRAHTGPVHALVHFGGRVYSSGGWGRHATIREWMTAGPLRVNQNLDKINACAWWLLVDAVGCVHACWGW